MNEEFEQMGLRRQICGLGERKIEWRGGGIPWDVYDSELKDYLSSFEGVVSEEQLGELLKRMASQKKRKLKALDIAGQGRALLGLKKYGVGSVVAVTLNDFRKRADRVIDSFRGLKVIEGNVLSGNTWSEIKNEKADGYDLVVSRPMGAARLVWSPVMGLALLDRMYRALSADGILLTQLPEHIIKTLGTSWIEELARVPELIVRFGRGERVGDRFLPELIIQRKPGAPNNLRLLRRTKPDPSNQKMQIGTEINGDG